MSDQLERLSNCNLCGSARLRRLFDLRGGFSHETFSLVRCLDCGLRFINPRLTAACNHALYDADYFSGRGFDGSVDYTSLQREAGFRRREGRGIIRKIAALKPGTDQRILDLGCGLGDLLVELGHAGYAQVTGVDLSEHAARIAQERSQARVLAGELADLTLGHSCFDVINATEVLEHVRDPSDFLARVADLLAPGGIFLYTTGNAAGLYARLLGRRWPYLVPEGHLFYYTPDTMRRYLEKAALTACDPRQLARTTRSELLRADDEITLAQMLYVGASDRGIKGRIFRLVAALADNPLRRLVTLAVGKCALPIGIKS